MNIRRIAIGLTVLAVVVAAAIVIGLRPPTPANMLGAMLGHGRCPQACWQGIQPGATDTDTVEAVFDRLDITFEVNPVRDSSGWDDVYRWPFISPFTPVRPDASTGSIWITDGVAQRIILPISPCLATVLDEYGQPAFTYAIDSTIGFGYPAEGLVFHAGGRDLFQTGSMKDVYLTTEEEIQALADIPSEFEDMQTILAIECVGPLN